MKVRSRDALLFALALLAGFTSLTAQDAPARPPTGLIVGQVIDAESGKPVSGATVAISGGRGSVREPERWTPTRLTNGDGYFVFRNLPAGRYGLLAEKPGYAPGGVGRRRPDGPTGQITLLTPDARRITISEDETKRLDLVKESAMAIR